ncbi:hypothetical protein [Anaeromassilibacillus senegalensis]|uniref:3-keto-L-gulonate-6-phosphate decarboxylase n=1 Tax=Anaeromassilibacillus senegalensis TaxID=1673717 RepID=A0ABS9CSE3_9FIRM|nr:hypothetical protein [Anaeromassilibacillus senegalensis]MCF2653266.1 hypothetical protein [Anaeromassilibacillus senegalensis]
MLQKIQAAGKCIQVTCTLEDVIPICEALKPEGAHLILTDCPDVDTAKALLRAAER